METLNIFLYESEDKSIPVPLDDNTTAQEILKYIAEGFKEIKETELHDFALFIKLDFSENTGLKERMLSSNECPLKIKVKKYSEKGPARY